MKSILGVQKPVRIWIDPTPGPLFDEALSALARHHAAEARENASQCAAKVQSITMTVWRFSKHITEPAEVAQIVEALQQIDERGFGLRGEHCYLKLHLSAGKSEEIVLKIHSFWTALLMVNRPEPNFPEPIWKHCLPLLEQQWQYIRDANERQDQQRRRKRN